MPVRCWIHARDGSQVLVHCGVGRFQVCNVGSQLGLRIGFELLAVCPEDGYATMHGRGTD